MFDRGEVEKGYVDCLIVGDMDKGYVDCLIGGDLEKGYFIFGKVL